jgi:hypothetical protein
MTEYFFSKCKIIKLITKHKQSILLSVTLFQLKCKIINEYIKAKKELLFILHLSLQFVNKRPKVDLSLMIFLLFFPKR